MNYQKMNKKKILLVGGCGFIGHNLAIYLKSMGHDPHIVDSLSVNNILSFTNEEIKKLNKENGIKRKVIKRKKRKENIKKKGGK